MGLAYTEPASSEGFAPQIVRVIFHNSTAAPGEGFKVDLHWQNAGDEPAARDYWIFVHFRPEGNLDEPYAGGGFSWDFPPARNTSRWPTHFVVKEEGCYFRVPAGVKPGRYAVLLGLYDRDADGDRIQLMNKSRDVGGWRYRVGHVDVVQNPGQPSKVRAYRLIWKVKEPGPSPAPREPRTITAGRISIGLDPGQPIVTGWSFDGKELLGGDPVRTGCEAEFVELANGRQHTSLALDAHWSFNSRISEKAALYKCKLRWHTQEVARFGLRFEATRQGLAVRLGTVQEAPGFHLISVTVPAVVSVSQSSPGAALVIPHQGGRLVDLTDSARHRHIQRVSLADPIPGAAVVSDKGAAAVWTKSLDHQIVSEIVEAGPKHGTLGIRFAVRMRAEKPELEFPVRHSAPLEVVAISRGGHGRTGRPLHWIDTAGLLAKNYRVRPNPLYTKGIIYKIFLDVPGSEEYTTFDEALDLIKRVRNLTNGASQVVYLVGWQHNGHDTGYPDTLTVNQKLGGLKGLRRLMEHAHRLGAVVSIHDNFDDAYEHSPAWDPSVVARDEAGNLMRGGVWAGGQSFILSATRYVESGEAARRIERTGSMLPLRQTIHLDVMSCEPVRVDHHPEVSASGDDVFAARKAIIEMWRRRGVDVTSEGLTAPYAGLMTHFWHGAKGQEGGPYSSETPIPLACAVLHGKVTWGGEIDEQHCEALTLLYGATFSEDWRKQTTDRHIADRYYLVTLPWSRLSAKTVVGYEVEGNLQRVRYEDDDFVEADLNSGYYRVVLGGTTVAESGTTLIPLGRREMAIYSREGKRLSIPLPEDWAKGGKPVVEALDSSGRRTHLGCALKNGMLEIDVPGGTPLIVTRP